jgi:hypothetical protein
MNKIKSYLSTFKPNNFANRARLIVSTLFTICMIWFFWTMYMVTGYLNEIEILKDNLFVVPFSIFMGILFYLSVDNIGGFGRDYINKSGWRNFFIIFPLWIAYFVIHWLLFING